MRVLQVIGNSAVGGAERHLLDLASGLVAEGVDVEVVAPRPGPFVDALRGLGLDVHLIEHVRSLPGDDYAFLPAAAQRLRRLTAELRPDVVHSHLYPAHLHASPVARQLGIPAVTTAHTLITRPADPLLSFATGATTIACSAAVRDLVVAAGTPVDQVVTIPNGIGAAHETPLPDTPRAGVLAVSRLSPEKGIDLLLRAFRRVADQQPQVRLSIAGDGPERDRLTALCDELHLSEQVTFLGSRDDVPALLRTAQVFVSPSREEAGPLAILEAMAAGCAVVATRVGGTPEVITDRQTGILVDPDPTALADALLERLQQPAQSTTMGRAARKRALSDFRLEHQVGHTMDLYHRITRRSHSMVWSRRRGRFQ